MQALTKEQAKNKENKEKASAGDRMRMLSLELWQKWEKIGYTLDTPS
jgi:hypothetical protein